MAAKGADSLLDWSPAAAGAGEPLSRSISQPTSAVLGTRSGGGRRHPPFRVRARLTIAEASPPWNQGSQHRGGRTPAEPQAAACSAAVEVLQDHEARRGQRLFPEQDVGQVAHTPMHSCDLPNSDWGPSTCPRKPQCMLVCADHSM